MSVKNKPNRTMGAAINSHYWHRTYIYGLKNMLTLVFQGSFGASICIKQTDTLLYVRLSLTQVGN